MPVTTTIIDIDVTTDDRQTCDAMAPKLDTAPDLLYNLGFCLAVSSTRSVARVVLSERAPAGPALSTNMIRIANEGSDAFRGAYKDLLNIANSSQELSQDGGLLDQLGSLLINGGSKDSKKLVYRWVQDCVDSCSAAGERTAGNFDHWRDTVRAVYEAVDMAKNSNEAKVQTTVKARKVTEQRAKTNSVEMATAIQEVLYAAQQKEAKSNIYEKSQAKHETVVADELNSYLFNPFWLAIKRPFKAVAGKSAVVDSANLRKEAERELEDALRELKARRKAELVFKLKAERLRAEIEEYMDEEASLKDILSTITSVCELLGGLSSDIAALLHTFAHISTEIEKLVNIRTRLEKPAGLNLGFARLNLFKKKPQLITPKKEDAAFQNGLFYQQTLRMKQVCMGIYVLSRLYADVINDVINYGFAEALRQSYDDLEGEGTSVRAVARERKKRMKKWHASAIAICNERNRRAAREFQSRLEGMNAAGVGGAPGGVLWGQFGTPPGGGAPGFGFGGQFGATFGSGAAPFPQTTSAPFGMSGGGPPSWGAPGYPPAGFGYPYGGPRMPYEAASGQPRGDGRVFVTSPSTGRPREVHEA